jgi:hypothetical protein
MTILGLDLGRGILLDPSPSSLLRESFMTATTTKSTVSRWQIYKPRLLALAIGLIAGPVITNLAGWQVTGSQVQNQVQAGIVEQQALFCAAEARIEVPDTLKLGYGARDKLAKKWAVMPGAAATKDDVVSACARKLAS